MTLTKNLMLLVLIGSLVQSQALAESIESALVDLEQTLEAKLGFYLHDLQSNETVQHAADKRFPMNSTFKLFACGALLARVDAGKNVLSEPIDLRDVELVPWSPSLTKLVDSGRSRVSLDSLCRILPASWAIEDRTGAGKYGTRGIVAVIYPPKRDPIIATMFIRDAEVSLSQRDAAMARIGRAIVQKVSPN